VFFKNAGSSQRQGVELSLNVQVAKGLVLFSNYTYSDFKYRDYKTLVGDFAGKALPGIPQHAAQAELRYFNPKGAFAIVQVRHASQLFADDANAVTANGYDLLNLRAGWTISKKSGKAAIYAEPFVGVNNLLNAVYFQNVQINAAANRYFEPAQGQFLFGGLKIGWH
jgi:iron complex outermembrane receptor protein